MEKRGISQYDLYMNYGIHRSLLDCLRHNKNIETFTLNKLCTIVICVILQNTFRMKQIQTRISETSPDFFCPVQERFVLQFFCKNKSFFV